MKKYSVAGSALVLVACLTGCAPSVECSDPDTQALVEQLFREKVYPQTSYADQPQMRARLEALADEKFVISDIITVRRPTDSNPAATCKAKLEHSLYEVTLDREKARRLEADAAAARQEIEESATGSESPSELAQQFDTINRPLEAFRSSPENLVRSRDRSTFTETFSYTVSQTDDGRLYVEIQRDGGR